MNNQNIISLEMSKTKMISIFVSSLLFFIFALILWKQQEIDFNILIKHNSVYENEIFFNFFKLVSRFGMGFISLFYSLIIFVSLRKDELKSNRQLFLFIIFAFAFGSIAGDLMKEIIGRVRPAVQLATQITHNLISDTSSFPSGHATKSMGLALPFILMASNKNNINKIIKVILLVASILVCYSRIALQRHFLSDVMAGVGIALFSVIIGRWIVNYIYKRRKIDEKKLKELLYKLSIIFLGLAVFLIFI